MLDDDNSGEADFQEVTGRALVWLLDEIQSLFATDGVTEHPPPWRTTASSPAQSGRDVGKDRLDHVSVVLNAELIGYG